jgi:hypothetical protein
MADQQLYSVVKSNMTLEHTDIIAQISLPYHEDSWWTESSFAEIISFQHTLTMSDLT